MRSLPGTAGRMQALIRYYSGLSPAQFEAEARKLANLNGIEHRDGCLQLLYGCWAEIDPMGAWAFSNALGDSFSFYTAEHLAARVAIVSGWASVDPAAAATYFAENRAEFGRMANMSDNHCAATIIAGEWARQDPAAALRWIQSCKNSNTLMAEVLQEVAHTDPGRAASMLAMAGEVPGASLRPAYEALAGQYGATDFKQAEAWIRTLPADQQDHALNAAIIGLAEKNPAEALRRLELNGQDDEERKAYVTANVIGKMARTDPGAAADVLKTSLNEWGDHPDMVRRGMEQLMPAWAAKDQAAALGFANSYPPGLVRDSALRAYFECPLKESPANLIKIAESMTDEGIRHSALQSLAIRWTSLDPAAANAYINQLDLFGSKK